MQTQKHEHADTHTVTHWDIVNLTMFYNVILIYLNVFLHGNIQNFPIYKKKNKAVKRLQYFHQQEKKFE